MKYSYKDGQIYKLYNKDNPEEVYIGSTKKPLEGRLKLHNDTINTCISKTIINPIIELIEKYPCNSRRELELRERYWIENTPGCINQRIPTRTKEEWVEANKDIIKEYQRQNYIKNREKKLAYQKEYQRQHYISKSAPSGLGNNRSRRLGTL
jgi:hypothetical protein